MTAEVRFPDMPNNCVMIMVMDHTGGRVYFQFEISFCILNKTYEIKIY